MKPHHLTIEALGPYPGIEEVDFDALAGEGLFLLHGPTGSGKTFVLDAIAFALYGRIPGARTSDSIRSDFAPAQARPSVILEFTAQRHRYRVERSPAYERPKKRGTGTTPESAKAVLQVLGESGWSPVAAKPTEVTSAIENLLGLDADQFKQVVMLPQGGFQRVLRAGSDDREKLLKTLFDIRSFDSLAEWLTQRARRHRAAEENARLLLDDLEARTRRTHGELAADLGVEVRSDPAFGDHPEGDQPQTPPPLSSLVDQAAQWEAAAVERADRSRQSAEEARVALESVRARAQRWDRRKSARDRLAELETRTNRMNDVEARLNRAREAEHLRPDMETVAVTEAELEAAENALAVAVRGLSAALTDAPLLPAEVAGPVGELPPTDRAAVEALTALSAYRTRIEGLVRREQQAHETLAAAAEDARRAAALAAAAEEAEAAVARLAADRAEAEAAREEAARKAEQVPELERRYRHQEQLRRIGAELAAARSRRAASEATVRDLESEVEAARTRVGELRSRFVSGLAGRLAAELVEGRECPVCGSRHHPDPAGTGPDSVATEDVERAEARLTALERSLEEARAEDSRLVSEMSRLEGALGGSEAATEATATEEVLARELEAARGARARVAELRESIADMGQESVRLSSQAAGSRAEARTLGSQAETNRTRAEEELATVRAELGEGVTASAALAGLGRVQEELTALREVLGERADARARSDTASARLAGALEASPFGSVAEARRALLPDEERQTMATALEEYRRAVAEVTSLLESPELAELPEDRPDVTSVEEASDVAARELQEAVAIRTLAAAGHRNLVELVAENEKGHTDLAELSRRAALYDTLAGRCAGKRAPKISLSRWVLAEYLREVCAHANRRLDVMTAGRYRLAVDENAKRRNLKAGLDLMVHDSHTGVARDVNTLSGGETFLASLALALGVADTVQAHTGGVHLDALFVDEGFGTLDADTLQLAVDELDKLREGGRMVGVVSHVPALRERLRTGIEIIPGPQGSTLRQGDIAPV